ncbi:MAG: ethanolamine ammonia-lyase subunit EutC [Zoogloeaceae bacterium]|nr:ethanolamine ammonia-lyase subunit EutC [Zoogloeaceae bacterium]
MSRGLRPDPWTVLRRLTPARVALGRAGHSLPTQEILQFGVAHAQARDAVHAPLHVATLAANLAPLGQPVLTVVSSAPDRPTYLMRPDLGRRLDPASAQHLDQQRPGPHDLLFVIGDGLSALAVARHAVPLLTHFHLARPPEWRIGPLVIASQCRVALGDEIGERLGAPMVAVLIGERPGLSSPDSLGIYLTRHPRVGRLDAERNCLSNIRPEGLPYVEAARRLAWLCQAAIQLDATGIALKDGSIDPAHLAPPNAAAGA